MGLLHRGDTPAQITIVEEPDREHVPQTGAVSSVQRAELELPAKELEQLWTAENLERLARAYWRWLNRISLGLLRVVYEPAARIVVLLFRPLALLRFRAPEYDTGETQASVKWPIERGLLVAKDGRDKGYLAISVKRLEGAPDGVARLCVSAEVSNFYPWLRGSGRFARFGTWVYSHTQVRIHELVTHGFLRSLAKLDLPPSRVGALRGEIEAGAQPDAEAQPEGLPPERAGN
jgi:hypothetical protein